MKNFNKLLYLVPFGLLVACTANNDTAGNTTEIENAIAIRLFEDGSPAANVRYQVLPSWYVADTTETGAVNYTYEGKTDTNGWVHIDGHQNGSYTINFTKGDSSIVLQYTLNNLNHEYTLDSASLEAAGTVKGLVDLPDSANYAWVAVQGVNTIVKTDSLGQFVIQKAPCGNVTVSAWDSDELSAIGETSASVTSNDTIDLGLIENPNKVIPENAIRFMPSDLISDWMRPLSFPTVLVLRLTEENFDFSKAEKDGSDIRLYDGSNNLIPFEIDGWDTTINSATLNIRVESAADTVRPWMLMWGDKKAKKIEDVKVWEGLSDSLVKALNSVEILNFESGTKYNALPAPLNNKFDWYVQPHDSATVKNDLNKDPTKGIEKADSSIFGKNVLHVQYSADKLGRYVVIGTRIAEHAHDLSRLDSVEVWIKGSGDFEVVLETIVESDTNYKTSYKESVNKEWTRVVAKPEDFGAPDNKSYHGWEVTRNKITRFTIFVYNGTDVWIDNVRMYGINLDDLL
ncbi:hypothetical protein [Fibrobacter sp.]|uniref:hypothetical protein n=1 Tax=Fibrobacter sp. TaxID=35828 RepID=UPI00386773AE